MGRGDRSRDSDERSAPSSLPQTSPPDFAQPGHDFTLQAVMEMQRSLTALGTKVDRLLDDRKEDRAEYRAELRDARSDFKEFRQQEFKPLSEEVTKLRIGWAKILGGGAVAGALASLLVGFFKAKFGG